MSCLRLAGLSEGEVAFLVWASPAQVVRVRVRVRLRVRVCMCVCVCVCGRARARVCVSCLVQRST
jgi:hypothetical protein